MTLTVEDLFGKCPCGATLADMITGGYVRSQVHPTLPLTIFNYTEKAAYEGVWNDVTLQCRGLIVNYSTGAVVARPFKKFFNYGQTGAPALDLDARCIVTDKLDGSMGIIFPTPDGPAVATRGSFTSEQALHATELLRRKYPDWEAPEGFTVLVEIIYPENRIVCDYGKTNDLILLGLVQIGNGQTLGAHWQGWPGPKARIFDYRTLAQALEATQRPNTEGFVLHFTVTDERMKIKQADYVALHRIVTGLNARTVWEHMCSGKTMEELITPLPDEFHEWVWDVALGIYESVNIEMSRLYGIYAEMTAATPFGWNPKSREGRKYFAELAGTHPDKWALFALLDGRDIYGELLKRAKPEPFITPSGRIYSEETA